MDYSVTHNKQVIAVGRKSRAEYRGVTIYETSDGCTFFAGGVQFDCTSLDEAKEAIDRLCVVIAEKQIGSNRGND